MTEATLISYAGKLTREQLALVPTPLGTSTHKPVPHIDVVQAIETLGFRGNRGRKSRKSGGKSGESG
ncbi:MAG: hypothetical protein L0387_41595 [Acidobacteria bacterium]|nr:hypothetical protein [Acidobacteriota bacterium]MCI0720994.1 hypothetical protein [Acidobacteriota bacterium]